MALLNLKNKKVLIIEDYAAMRKAIKDMLLSLNAQDVTEAENGASALESMKLIRFDIVLSDYNLGSGKNGQQVLEEARHLRLLPYYAVFIMITAEQNQAMVLSAMENKPDEYLTKPFTTQQLLTRIERNYQRKQFLAPIEREIDRGNWAQAIENCEAMLANTEKAQRMTLLKMRAELALQVNDLDAAQRIYHDVLDERQLLWAVFGLGRVYYLRGDYAQAALIFQDLIEQNPMMMEAYDWLAKTHEAQGNALHAEEVLAAATELSPRAILRQRKLATIADKNGHFDTAKQAYQVTVDLGKQSVHRASSDYAGLAKIYTKTNEVDQAISTLGTLRKIFTNDPEAELRAAVLETQIHHAQGDEAQAQAAYQKLLALHEQIGAQLPQDMQLDLAKTYYLRGEHEKADALLEPLVKNNIDDEGFIAEIQAMQAETGVADRAAVLIAEARQALVQTNNQGVGLFRQGRIKEAIAVFEHAITTMPRNKTVMLNMLKILLHEAKIADKPSKDKLERIKNLLQQAKALGIEADKLGTLQMEFTKILHNQLKAQQNDATTA